MRGCRPGSLALTPSLLGLQQSPEAQLDRSTRGRPGWGWCWPSSSPQRAFSGQAATTPELESTHAPFSRQLPSAASSLLLKPLARGRGGLEGGFNDVCPGEQTAPLPPVSTLSLLNLTGIAETSPQAVLSLGEKGYVQCCSVPGSPASMEVFPAVCFSLGSVPASCPALLPPCPVLPGSLVGACRARDLLTAHTCPQPSREDLKHELAESTRLVCLQGSSSQPTLQHPGVFKAGLQVGYRDQPSWTCSVCGLTRVRGLT